MNSHISTADVNAKQLEVVQEVTEFVRIRTKYLCSPSIFQNFTARTTVDIMISQIFTVALIATSIVASLAFEIPENIHLKPRTQAPAFKAKAVLDDKFVNVALADYIAAKKWTVLLFYPFDYTFVCPVSTPVYTYYLRHNLTVLVMQPF